MSYRTDEIDRSVLNSLPTEHREAIAVVDLAHDNWLKLGTIRNALKRLLDEGAIERIWDGNERFGRFLYYAR
jgi:DNA-binding Lrp family transcriptional regulator